jgi:hypothetical protein
VLQSGLYTCGGAANPDGSCQAHPGPSPGLVAVLVTNAPKVYAEMERATFENFHRYGVKGRLKQ